MAFAVHERVVCCCFVNSRQRGAPSIDSSSDSPIDSPIDSPSDSPSDSPIDSPVRLWDAIRS